MSDAIAAPRALTDLHAAEGLGGGELARRWGVSLVLSRPLERIGEVPLEEIAARGPWLCAAVLDAVRSDEALDRLSGPADGGGPTPAAALQELAGASEPAELVDAVEALRKVLWDALFERLPRRGLGPSPALVGDACDRLAHVCSRLLAEATREPPVPATAGTPGRFAEAGVPAALPPHEAAGAEAPRRRVAGAVIVDERLGEGEEAPVEAAGRVHAGAHALASTVRPPPGRPTGPAARAPEIEIRDERTPGGPGAWIGAIGRQLDRFRSGGAPFCVLLVEALGYERLRRSGPPDESERLAAALEELLVAELRATAASSVGPSPRMSASWAGSLTRERPGRLWLIAPGHDRAAGEALSERLLRAIAEHGAPWAGMLEPAIGTAACPQDGQEASALAAHADVSLYAARAAARMAAGGRERPGGAR